MGADQDAGARRRPQWRGERKAVLVRMPVEMAELLTSVARREQCSVSEQAAALLAEALTRGSETQ